MIETKLRNQQNVATVDSCFKCDSNMIFQLFCSLFVVMRYDMDGCLNLGPSEITTTTADRLAQLVEHRAPVREVVGSNPGRTNTQGLKITKEKVLPL